MRDLIHEVGHYFGLSEEEIEAIEERWWNGDELEGDEPSTRAPHLRGKSQ